MSEKSLTSYHAAIQFQGYMFEKLSFSYHGNNGKVVRVAVETVRIVDEL